MGMSSSAKNITTKRWREKTVSHYTTFHSLCQRVELQQARQITKLVHLLYGTLTTQDKYQGGKEPLSL
jgi:hypothetical protein